MWAFQIGLHPTPEQKPIAGIRTPKNGSILFTVCRITLCQQNPLNLISVQRLRRSSGKSLVVHNMDCPARNLDDQRKIVLSFTKRGVKVRFIKESLTFTGEDSPMENLLLSMLGTVAQSERELIRERQREGIALAKKAGVYKGRVPSLPPRKPLRSARGSRKVRMSQS